MTLIYADHIADFGSLELEARDEKNLIAGPRSVFNVLCGKRMKTTLN